MFYVPFYGTRPFMLVVIRTKGELTSSKETILLSTVRNSLIDNIKGLIPANSTRPWYAT